MKAPRSHAALVRAQIVGLLLFFRGTCRKDFDSRWKSFTLVKKSMENRVSLNSRARGPGTGIEDSSLSTCPAASREEAAYSSAPHRSRAAAA